MLTAAAADVPFIGCQADTQTDRLKAPKGNGMSVPIDQQAAQALAYYKSDASWGVLAPRGWYCYGVSGSSGDALYVSPTPIDRAHLFSTKGGGFLGPAIEISHKLGETIGRFDVADVIARVFPAYRQFATDVMELFDQPHNSLPSGPYPTDTLAYKSNRLVEFQTPPQTEGLGTHFWLRKSAIPIDGVAILVGPTPDLLLLSVRLPPELSALSSVIVHQVEYEAVRGGN